MYGVGSGYLPHEFAGFGIDSASKRELFEAALATIEALFAGERATPGDIAINVRPMQRRVPIYVGVLRKESAYFVGRQGRNLMCVPYASVESFDAIADIAGEFRRGRAEAGVAADKDSIALALHAHVADSDAAARRDAAECFDRYVASRLYAKKATYDDVMRSGLHLFGSPAHVARKLAALRDMGVHHVMGLHNFGAMPDALARQSMQRLIQETDRA